MIKKHLSGLVTALLAAALIISGCSSYSPTTAPGEASTSAAAGAAAEDTSETGSTGSAAGEEANATDGAGRTQAAEGQSTAATMAAAEAAGQAETAGQAEKTATIVTNSGRLRVRSGPGADYDIVTYLNNGDTVTVLSLDGDWAQIRTADGQEGYVSTAFLRIEEAETAASGNTAEEASQADTAEQAEAAETGETEAEAGSAEQTEGERTATVSTSSGRLRVRSGPGANYDIVAYLHNDDTVTVLSIDGDWAKIRTADGEEGYVSVSFLHMTEGTEAAEEETEAADEGETLEEEETTEPAAEEEEETTEPAAEEEEETTEPAAEETETADEGAAEEVNAAASRYSVYAGAAFEELSNVRAEMNEDGSYYYEDQTGDGVTVVNSAYTGRLTYTESAGKGTTGETADAVDSAEQEAAEDTAENADSISLVSAYLTKVLSGHGMTDISDMTVEKSETIEENIPDEAKAEAWTATWTMKADGSEKTCRGAVICTETFTYVYYLSVDSDQAQDTQEKHTEIIRGLTLMDGEG